MFVQPTFQGKMITVKIILWYTENIFAFPKLSVAHQQPITASWTLWQKMRLWRGASLSQALTGAQVFLSQIPSILFHHSPDNGKHKGMLANTDDYKTCNWSHGQSILNVRFVPANCRQAPRSTGTSPGIQLMLGVIIRDYASHTPISSERGQENASLHHHSAA